MLSGKRGCPRSSTAGSAVWPFANVRSGHASVPAAVKAPSPNAVARRTSQSTPCLHPAPPSKLDTYMCKCSNEATGVPL